MSKELPQPRTFQNKGAKIGIFLLFMPRKRFFFLPSKTIGRLKYPRFKLFM